jgi:HK97 family phage major capsid protein
VIANSIDHQAMVGTGASNTPVGVSDGATAATLAGPTWAQVLAMISSVQFANADIGSLGWAMNAQAVGKLRATTKVSSDAGAGFLMDDPGTMAGYMVGMTNSLDGAVGPSPDVPAEVIFGAWSQLMIGYWTGTDILVNPYDSTQYVKGGVLVRAMRDVDVKVRHEESFAYAADMPLA